GRPVAPATTAGPPGGSASPPVPAVTSPGEVRAPGRQVGLLLAGLLMGWPAAGSAQSVTMAPWQGELEATSGYDREESKTKGLPRERFENPVAQEVLTLRNPAIHVYDPRLLTLSVEGSFGLYQERLTETTGQVGDFHSGTLLGYDFLLQLLA